MKKSIQVSVNELFNLLATTKHSGFAHVSFTNKVDNTLNLDITKTTTQTICLGSEYENVLNRILTEKGIPREEYNTTNRKAQYDKYNKIACIYHNVGDMAVGMLIIKNKTKSIYHFEGKDYTKKELIEKGILTEEQFKRKEFGVFEGTNVAWNVLKLFNINSISFDNNIYVLDKKECKVLEENSNFLKSLKEAKKKVNTLKREKDLKNWTDKLNELNKELKFKQINSSQYNEKYIKEII